MRRLTSILLKPYWIFAFTTSLSLLAWMLPLSGGIFVKGFSPPEEFFTADIIYVIIWNFGVFAVAFFGFHIGKKFKLRKKYDDGILRSLNSYYFLTIVGVAGLVSSYIHIIHVSGLSFLILQLIEHNGNILKKSLYTNYAIGVYSLRYVVIVSASLAAYRISKRNIKVIDLINLTSLVFSIIISSRLSLIIFIVIASSLIFSDRDIRIRSRSAFVTIVSVFLVLTTANYVRNANFYESLKIDNPLIMNIAQIDAYLGTAFQGELATANHSLLRSGLKLTLQSQSGITNIATNFNANSALNSLMNSYGLLGILIGWIYSFFGSLAMGVISGYEKNYLYCVYGTLLYCFSDLYRIFMFDKGIIITMIMFIFLSEFIYKLRFSRTHNKNYRGLFDR